MLSPSENRESSISRVLSAWRVALGRWNRCFCEVSLTSSLTPRSFGRIPERLPLERADSVRSPKLDFRHELCQLFGMKAELDRPDPIVKTLFQQKFGPVHCVVRGPLEGFLWRRVELFRFVPCTKNAGKWHKSTDWRHSDLKYLAAAVKAARKVCDS
jgi:hypothetical protein